MRPARCERLLPEQQYPEFREERASEGRSLPRYAQVEFEADLKCGRLEAGLMRLRCEGCHAERLVAFIAGGVVFVLRSVAGARLRPALAAVEFVQAVTYALPESVG